MAKLMDVTVTVPFYGLGLDVSLEGFYSDHFEPDHLWLTAIHDPLDPENVKLLSIQAGQPVSFYLDHAAEIDRLIQAQLADEAERAEDAAEDR